MSWGLAPGVKDADVSSDHVINEDEDASAEAVDVTARVLDAVVAHMGGAARSGQQDMARVVSRAMSAREHVIVQAGTGTGKSLGYLVPLLVDCARRGNRGLVSTATLALQRQILVKDAPAVIDAVAEHTGVRLRVAVLKGWSNYLCLNRISGGYPDEDALFSLEGSDTEKSDAADRYATDSGREIIRLREWAKTTDTGDRDDLTPGVPDLVWRRASVSKRECLGKTCPFINECFAQRARETANDADVVVTNHSLFGINATGDTDLFPGINAVVIDEAHELAGRVRDQARVDLSQSLVTRVARTLRTHAKISVSALEKGAIALGSALEPLDEGLLVERPEALRDALIDVNDALGQAGRELKNSSVDAASKTLARAAIDELAEAIAAWSADPERMITWVTRPDVGSEHLNLAPLDVAPALGSRGFGDRPAILTSATLKLGGSFTSIAHDCGLSISGQPWNGIDVGTPFVPQSQGILYTAAHIPPPGHSGPSPQVLDELVDLVRAAGGGTLALFSSWKAAQAGAQALRKDTEFPILMQGEDTVSALVTRFREDTDSCLVGTLSLWQGVDVVGHSCRLVVIDRIPFPHPEDPVAQARSRDAERRGLNGFRTVSLTHASLLMAQGAGRLLRSVSDRGVVAVLDSRLSTKSYGAFIRASMPPLWPTEDPDVVRSALQRLRDSSGDA
ncbi:ATP-dependent DNA helicase [Schaalia sp. ZJ405]|nr:ATP-dependent DNA helicase [Schaalia sp. ZJ405]